MDVEESRYVQDKYKLPDKNNKKEKYTSKTQSSLTAFRLTTYILNHP